MVQRPSIASPKLLCLLHKASTAKKSNHLGNARIQQSWENDIHRRFHSYKWVSCIGSMQASTTSDPASSSYQFLIFCVYLVAFTKCTLTQNNKTSLALKMQKTLKPKKNFIQVDNSGLCHHQNDGWLPTPHDLPSFELLYILYPSI